MLEGKWVRGIYMLVAVLIIGVLSENAAADIQVVSRFKALPSCDGGTGVPANGLCFKEFDGTPRDWNAAKLYCQGFAGYRLPTKTELDGLYNTYPGNQMNSIFGWGTMGAYWSSTASPSSGHYWIVHLSDGSPMEYYYTWTTYVTCVRVGV